MTVELKEEDTESQIEKLSLYMAAQQKQDEKPSSCPYPTIKIPQDRDQETVAILTSRVASWFLGDGTAQVAEKWVALVRQRSGTFGPSGSPTSGFVRFRRWWISPVRGFHHPIEGAVQMEKACKEFMVFLSLMKNVSRELEQMGKLFQILVCRNWRRRRKVTWRDEKDGVFTVKSVHIFLISRRCNKQEMHDFQARTIWAIEVPAMMYLFVWEVLGVYSRRTG